MSTPTLNTKLNTDLINILDGIRTGSIVPYLGPGVLADVTSASTSEKMAATSDELILAMNNGPMAPKLMYEFPRAAMNLELKRGRKFVTNFLDEHYSKSDWSRSALHDLIADLKPHYVIDINRDTQLQDSYSQTLHILVRGISRVAGINYRFTLHKYDGEKYQPIEQEQVDPSLPVLFKPMGSPKPDPTYIASDADYVDYITELMGGFAIPDFLKNYRKGKQYCFIGLRMLRDTERMVLSDIIYAAGQPAGYALIPEPTKKEEKFCAKHKIEIINADVADLITAAGKHENAA